MKRPQLSIRGMMIAIAVLALVFAGVEALSVQRRQWMYRMRADSYFARELGARDQEWLSREKAQEELKRIEDYGQEFRRLQRENPSMDPDSFWESRRRTQHELAQNSAQVGAQHLLRARQLASLADYYAAMKQKYQAAAQHPWQVVGPDPAPPPSPTLPP